MQRYYFTLNLTHQDCLAYYQGRMSSVQVKEDSGKTIRFPAKHILPFISPQGIRGRFCLVLTNGNKFVRLEQVK